MTLTEPQIWVLIGTFSAAILGSLGLTATMFTRTLKAEIGGLRGEMIARFETADARLSGRMDGIDRRLDGLDRDVQSLTERMMRDGS